MRRPKRILSVDPGLMSGVCIVTWDDATQRLTLEKADELVFPSLVRFLEEEICRDVEGTGLVAEAFTITARTAQLSQAPWSLEGIGAMRAVAQLAGSTFAVELQKPGDAKVLVDNKTLHNMKLWTKGKKGHANDAARHAVVYAVRHGMIDERLRPSMRMGEDDAEALPNTEA